MAGMMADYYDSRLSQGQCGSFDEEEVDPRIQEELEKLNHSGEAINKLELELDDARAAFRQVLSDSTQRLNTLAKKLGTCVEKARPYYEARVKGHESHKETQRVAIRYERACSMHEAAKEMVQLAEQGYMKRELDADPAWQEMLNHATMKVNEAEKERIESEKEHAVATVVFKQAEDQVQKLQKDLKRAIAKSKPYFEIKAKFNQQMDERKIKVSHLEEDISSSKSLYSQALRNLESISDEIHQHRREKLQHKRLGERSAGVGTDSPLPPPSRDQEDDDFDGKYPIYKNPDSAMYDSKQLSSSVPYGEDPLSRGFHPPSVIHSSPANSRRRSYRDAIESRKSVSPSISVIDSSNFDAPALEEEYKDLPQPRSSAAMPSHFNESPRNLQGPPRPRQNNEVIHPLVAQRSIDRNHMQAPSTVDASQYPSNSQILSLSKAKQNIAIRHPLISQRSVEHHPLRQYDHLRTSGDSQTKGNEYAKVHTAPSLPRPGSTSSATSSPNNSPAASRKQKLQGIILKIDAALDNKAQMYYPGSNANPPPYTHTHESQTVPFDVDSIVEMRKKDPDSGTSTLRSDTSERLEDDEKTIGVKLLRTPSASDILDDASDAESVCSSSMGPMLDDDQVEMLTLSFTDTAITMDDSYIRKDPFDRKRWQRRSLPPQFSHLEKYMPHSEKVDSDNIRSVVEEPEAAT